MNRPPSETQRVAAELSRNLRHLTPGDDVGSVRSIAAEYGVSPDVARRALGQLVRTGQVRAEARRHVVADPTAPNVREVPEWMLIRLNELESEVSRLTEADEQSRAQVGQLQAELAELYGRTGHTYPPGATRGH